MLLPQLCLNLANELQKKKHVFTSGSPCYSVTIKKDGVYGFVDFNLKSYTKSRITSRQLKTIRSLEKYELLFEKVLHLLCCNRSPEISSSTTVRLIFEIVVDDVPFGVGAGLLNKSVGDYALPLGKVKFYCHDLVLLDNLSVPATVRQVLLKEIVFYRNLGLRAEELTFIFLDQIGLASSPQELIDLAQEYISLGEEGIVAKRLYSHYSPAKRNSDLLKVKVETTELMEIVDLVYSIGGKGNDAWCLEVKATDGTTTQVVVGKHEYLDLLLNDERRGFVGKKVSIVYMCRSHLGGLLQPRLDPNKDLKEYLE